VALVSSLLKRPIRKDLAMTGEITLQGRVLPIGGLQEKLLAAKRAGIEMVLIPTDNERDLKEIPDRVYKGLNIKLVSSIDDVFQFAFHLA
jgi:ATP-dependent Lon protease